MNLIKKIIVSVLCVTMLLPLSGMTVIAEEDEDNEIEYIDLGVLVLNNVYSAKELLSQARFTNPGGHGFAAEEANNLIDNIKGVNAEVVGYNNKANGADRMITRSGKHINIQDKYWSTAKRTVSSAFDNTRDGMYKYMNKDGTPMQLEVPADQYDDVVEMFASKIKDGKVKGVTDPNEAENYVRKGNVTYQQAVNISKAGTIESLIYDSAKGCVTATTAFGISTTIDFAIRTINGESWDEAIKNSAMTGLKTGVNSFAIFVITSQLSKANVFEPTAKALVNSLGDDYVKAFLNVYGVNRATTATAKKAATKLLQNQMLASSVTVFVITVPDAVDLIRGRISEKQLLKNLAITTAGVAGGVIGNAAGSAAGTAIAPGAGSAVGGFVGGVIGGVAAGTAAEIVLGIFVEDDAEEMLEIVQDVFHEEAVNYIATNDEAEDAAQRLSELFNGTTLKDMFESEDRYAFARDIITPIFDEVISNRELIDMPSSEEMRYQLIQQLDGVVMIH